MQKILSIPVSRTCLVKEQVLPFDPAEEVRTARGFARLMAPLVELEVSESLFCISLNARRRPLQIVRVSTGILTQALAHPREVFRAAIIASAAAIVVCHNHPSGDPAPSPEDHVLTYRLREAGLLLALPMADHLILGAGDTYFSYAENGWPRS